MDGCEHKNILRIFADYRDMGGVRWPDGTDHEGYIPGDLGLTDGGGLNIGICVDCKRVPELPSAEAIEKVRQAVVDGAY